MRTAKMAGVMTWETQAMHNLLRRCGLTVWYFFVGVSRSSSVRSKGYVQNSMT